MTLYPNVQRKAQEELDRVVGPSRLPNFEDRKQLLYINAVIKEMFRWHPLAPLGLPHMTDQDDVVNGYLIPKGSVLLPNIW
jgi:cytochrome P450